MAKKSQVIEDSSEEDIEEFDSAEENSEVGEEEGVDEEEVDDEEEADEEEDDEDEDDEEDAEDAEELDLEDGLDALPEDDPSVSESDDAVAAAVPESRMTARQRNKRDGTSANIGLIDIAEIEGTRSKKVQLSAEEQRIKRAEMARRRRNQSQQRLEEEKKETLDKLLKKRAKKVRGNAEDVSAEGVKIARSRLHPPHPALTNWRSVGDKLILSVTEERSKRF